MKITKLDHVNILTHNLAKMVQWYDDVLGLKSGHRPDFPNEGAWIYVGDDPVVHLSAVPHACAATDPRIEHFAFAAIGLGQLLAHLTSLGIAHSINVVSEKSMTQVNLADCDGNHIHIDFLDEA